MWALSPSDNNTQINNFKASYGQTFPAAGTQGGGPAAKNVVISGQTFNGYPTYAVICPDRTIHFDVCWPPTLSCLTGYVNQCVPPPITTDFSTDNQTPDMFETVNFTDLSSDNPNAWDWSFNPSSVSYVGGTNPNSQNPMVQFNENGYYSVTLTAFNIEGDDTEVKLNYIYVSGEPITNFESDNTMPGIDQTVNFTDLSLDNPTSWAWSFSPSSITYVEGTSSSSQNPKVKFNTEGYYSVSLTASNVFGSDIETKVNYINTLLYCGASGATSYLEIVQVQLESINNTSGQDYYSDYTDISTDLTTDQYYEITVNNGDSYASADLSVWIDWDQDATFNNMDEHIVCEFSNGGQGTYSFTVPPTAISGTTRMRIRAKYNGDDCGDPCGTTPYGEVEDYSINIIPVVYPPVADFEANNTMPVVGETVEFSDMSTNSPTSWSWSFTPATISYVGFYNSESQNPEVVFNEAGYYTVELTATNSGGSDMETKTDYIYVSFPSLDLDLKVFLEGPFNNGLMNTDLVSVLPLNQPYNVSPWNYNGSENVVSIPGDAVDWVLIELREATTPSLATEITAFNWQAAFISNDGKIVNLDGSPVLHFESSVSNSLYVVIHHRNHLSIMSAIGLVENGGIYSYDYTMDVNQVYGGTDGHKELTSGVWGMFSGDGNKNGTIETGDKSPIIDNEAGTHGYLSGDYNLDSEANNIDKDDLWVPNIGKGTQVPN